jgi:hypothetical protein
MLRITAHVACTDGFTPRRHLLPPLLQRLSPFGAFHLTPGRVWSTDTPFKTCLSGRGAGAFAHTPPTTRAAVPEGTPMSCPRCEADSPQGMKFCIECAAPLMRRCPPCGFANPPEAKFCGQCASALQGPLLATVSPSYSPHPQTPRSSTPPHLAEKILTSKTALEGERKQVTVLFAGPQGLHGVVGRARPGRGPLTPRPGSSA